MADHILTETMHAAKVTTLGWSDSYTFDVAQLRSSGVFDSDETIASIKFSVDSQYPYGMYFYLRVVIDGTTSQRSPTAVSGASQSGTHVKMKTNTTATATYAPPFQSGELIFVFELTSEQQKSNINNGYYSQFKNLTITLIGSKYSGTSDEDSVTNNPIFIWPAQNNSIVYSQHPIFLARNSAGTSATNGYMKIFINEVDQNLNVIGTNPLWDSGVKATTSTGMLLLYCNATLTPGSQYFIRVLEYNSASGSIQGYTTRYFQVASSITTGQDEGGDSHTAYLLPQANTSIQAQQIEDLFASLSSYYGYILT